MAPSWPEVEQLKNITNEMNKMWRIEVPLVDVLALL
jgi:hypothetical protein